LPFVCRLKDAKAGKTEQNVMQVGNSEKAVNAKLRMIQQQSATPGNNLEALC
jgi:hypothetical protein